LLLLAIVALLAAGLTACGGDSGDSTGTTASTPTETTATSPSGGEGGKADKGGSKKNGEGSGESTSGSGSKSDPNEKGSESFIVPGGDNSIQNYGDEAETGELEEAEREISGFLDARAKGDWAGVCTYLAKTTLKPIETLAAKAAQLKGKDCGELLETLSGATPAAARVNTMTNGLASFRAEGERGFALYHGADGADYFVPMVNEDGSWKVGALAPTEVFGRVP
jgi:hypothetical protein